MSDGKQQQRIAEEPSWGGRSSTGASGPLPPAGRRPAAGPQPAGGGLRFGWRPDAPDFPAELPNGQPSQIQKTGENPYAALPPFEFPYPVHESRHRAPVKIIPPVFAVLVVLVAFLARDRWLPAPSFPSATATLTAGATSVAATPTAAESLLTEVAGGAMPSTPTTDTPATPAATPTPGATATFTPGDDRAPGFEPGLVEAADGDTLIAIAEAIGLNVSTLVWANDIEDPGAPLDAGTLVVVPPTDGVLHTVAEGESLASIAQTYGVDPSVITGVAENGIVSDLDVEPGMVLLVPGARLPSRADSATYTVREGDNLWGIADYYGLNPFTLAWANDLAEPFIIQAGQTLVVPPADGIFLLVQEGQTIESIAAHYGVEIGLIRGFAFNRMQDPFAQPKVGQPLMIPSLDALARAWDGGEPAAVPEPEGSGAPGDGDETNEVASGAGHATGSFIWPTDGFISQGFGAGHTGLDIANVAGTPIYAADGGSVIFAGWNDAGLGFAVGIDHGDGLETWYGHLAEAPAVVAGQPVAKGDYLGAMGSTGRSTGPHLHFIVMHNETYQDPLAWLP